MSFKIPLSILASIICFNSFAGYTAIYPVKFVNFVQPPVKWEDTDSLYSAWTNTSSPSNCKNQAPLENTIPVGQSYEKTMSQCDMSQERTVTKQLIRHDTGEVKANGEYQENRVINDYTYKIQSVGTLVAEECRYSNSSQTYYWYDISRAEGATDGQGSLLMWNSVQIKSTLSSSNGSQPTEFIVGSYKYKRSIYKEKTKRNETMWYVFYQICRTPI